MITGLGFGLEDYWPWPWPRTCCPRTHPCLMGTLKAQSSGPLYCNSVIGKLAVDGWAVTFGTARRGLDGLRPRPIPLSLYRM